jgi:hypothetical protein
MKRFILLFILIGLSTQGFAQSLIHNSQRLYDTYIEFQKDLKEEGVVVTRDMLNVRYLLVDDGYDNGPEKGSETKSDITKRYIIFSRDVSMDDKKLKAAMYRELTRFLRLGLTQEDSKILKSRESNYDYTQIKERDYRKLLRLIRKEINTQFEQIIIPSVG